MQKVIYSVFRHLFRQARIMLVVMLMMAGAINVSAQVLNVTGKVTDSENEPIIGASVKVRGSKTGVITDVDGKYTIQARHGDVIIVDYVGCKPEEKTVGSKPVIDFSLQGDTKFLDEVVVVGYGVVKKKDLTGAVAQVKGDKVAERRTTQLSNALQGAMAGVQVNRSSGQPGVGASSILIRGVTTIGDTSPLIIVDGVPVDNINDVNAADVEDISVLKDAASAAIYGSRAASGVILITTRRGSEKDPQVSYNFEYGLEIPSSQPKQVSFQRYLEMVNELRYNDNPEGGWYQEYSKDEVENWVANNATDPDNYPITDWYKLLVKGSAPRQTHSVSFSGGTKKVKSRATMSYDRVDGLFKEATNRYERLMARANNDFTFSKWVSASLDLNVDYAYSNRPEFTSVWTAIYDYSPAYAAVWSNGGMADVKSGSNPYGRLVDGGSIKTRTTKLGGKASINFTPIEGLRLSGIVAPGITYVSPKTFIKAVPYNPQDDPTVISGYLSGNEYTSLTEERNTAYSITWQALANYTRTFGKHDINVLLGYESYMYHHENVDAESSHFDLDQFPYLDDGNKDYVSVAGGAYENAYQSWFGRVMYNYDDRYLLQFNIRRDGSSRFASDYRWGTFPSVSAGWIMTHEKFMKNLKPSGLSFLKLRASWGRLGNERIGNYPYIALMDLTSALLYSSPDATVPTYYKGAAQIQYALRNITWETTESWDAGVDARFLNNRLSLTADFYSKSTRDMLLALEIPKYVGYANPEQNAGKMNTKGYDIELGWNDHIGELSYNVSVNFSDYLSKMTDMKGRMMFDNSSSPTRLTTDGHYYQEWYGYLSDGIFQNADELDGAAVINSTTRVGDIRYKDIDGDGKITPEKDRVFLGNSLPRYLYGGNITVNWRGIDFSASFQGVGSQKVRKTETMVQPYKNNWGSIPAIIDGHYWSENNTAEENLKATYPRLTYVNRNSNNVMSDFWIFNGRYFRMKNITLGYTLPKALTKTVHIQNVRFYVSANDLFCLNGYPKGFDPERTASQYPITTQLLFGVNVNF